jgi:SAM-dependent methyltransferase
MREKDKIMSMVNRICPVCNSNDADEIYSNPNYKIMDARGILYHTPIYYVICNCCAHIYQNPAPDKEEYKQFYSNAMITPSVNLDEEYERGELHWRVFVEMMDGYFKGLLSKISVLEIGCGNGYLLHKLNEMFSLKIASLKGIEPSVRLSERANSLAGIEVENKFLDDIDFDTQYDLIIMDNVFEHLDFPIMDLHKIRRILKEYGIIYISVPNLFLSTSGIRDIFAGHPSNYGIENFMVLMEKAGFWVEKYRYISTWLVTKVRFKKEDEKLSDFNFDKIRDEVGKQFQVFVSKNRLLTDEIKSFLEIEIEKMVFNSQKLLIFGAGEHTLELLDRLDFKNIVIGLIDNNKVYQGNVRMEYPVYSPEDLGNLNYDKILLSSNAFEWEMKKTLLDKGIPEAKIIPIYEILSQNSS